VAGVSLPASTKSTLSKSLSERPPRLVAILPFENLSGKVAEEEEKGAENVVRSAFANHFTTRRYETQRTVVTDRLLQEQGLVKPADIVALPPSRVGELTKAEAVIYGQITHFDKFYAGPSAQ